MDPAPERHELDPRIDRALAAELLAAAAGHLGADPTWARIGYSEYRSDASYSVTCAATAGGLLAIAELRVRTGSAHHVVVQVVPRSHITQVAACGGRTYAVLDAVLDASVAQEVGFHIEGPLVSLPDHTEAHRVLP